MGMNFSEMNLPRFPLLSDEEAMELLQRAQAGDAVAREKLINSNLRLVFNLVQRFEHRGYELEDLFQIGVIGLIKAIDKFDLKYNVKFSTYAVPMIVGEIRRFLRDDSPVKVSRSLKEKAYHAYSVKEDLTGKLGREPSVREISQAMGLPVEELVGALEAVQAPTSIYETIYQDEGDPIYILDQLGQSEDEGDPGWFTKIALKDLLTGLPERHREVILLRFYEDKTQSQVAEQIGLSQVQVSRIERQALRQLRDFLQQPPETET